MTPPTEMKTPGSDQEESVFRCKLKVVAGGVGKAVPQASGD